MFKKLLQTTSQKVKREDSKGFTLIELLVVISIVGLLSSVVLASLSVARQRGVVASAIEFADHNYHLLGVDTVALWNFNDATSFPWTSTIDTGSGNNLALKANIILIPRSFSRSQDTPLGSGYSLYSTNNFPAGTAAIPSGKVIDSSGITTSFWWPW